MEQRNEDQRPPTESEHKQASRFSIEKLEERIAPWCPRINPHGKCVGWRSVKGDL